MSRKVLGILAVIVVIVIILFATGFWDVNQTEEGALPDVDVSAEGGELPAFDVDSKEVVVGTTETNIEVPKVETETETVEVPVVAAMGIMTELTATLMLSPIGTETLATQFWARTGEFDHMGAAPFALAMVVLSVPLCVILHRQATGAR